MWNKIMVFFFLLILLVGVLTIAVAAEKPAFFVSTAGNYDLGEELPADSVKCWFSYSGKGYIFLPSSCRADQLFIYFDNQSSLLLNGTEVHSGDAVSFFPGQEIQISGDRITPFTVAVLQSSNIPAIFINTESGSMDTIHQKKGNKESGSMYMVDADGTVEYSGSLKYIKARGNSTFDYPKKPYQIKLEASAPLCGMRKNKTFVLLANYLDRSEIRNTLAFDLARFSDAYVFTPECQSADLYLNHIYAGCYLLTEKCEIDKDRLNITNLESIVEKINQELPETYPFVGKTHYSIGAIRSYSIPNEPEDITGGYLMMANNTEYFQNEASGFVTSHGQAFTMQSPKYTSTLQIEYISGIMQQIENALFAKDGRDPATGKHFSELLDMKSFVNRYLQSEILNDFDGQYPYFYKDSDAVDGLVYCGPVWDQDNILGVSARRPGADYLSLDREQKRNYFWFTQAVKQPDFREEMIRTYYAVYRLAYLILLGEETDETGTLRSIDQYMEEIRDSAQMDHTRWSRTTWNQKSGGNTGAGETPEECAAFLKQFIRTHMAVMDKAYPFPDN